MQGTHRDELIAAKLATSVAATEDDSARASNLAAAISRLTPDEAGPALGALVRESCRRVDSAMAFLILMDRPEVEQCAPEWDWRQLDGWFNETIMDEVWKLFNRLSRENATMVRAKVSLLEELHYVILSDRTRADEGTDPPNGAEIALRILKSSSPGSDWLEVRLSDYPMEQRRVLKEILSELDFLEDTPGVWTYNLTPTVMDSLARGENLTSHGSDSLLAQALAARRAEGFIKRLELLIRSMQMFPAGHPSITPALDTFQETLGDLLSSDPQVTISITGDSIMVNSARVRRKCGAAQECIRMMLDRKINSITFYTGTGIEEMSAFAGVFNRPPAYIEEHGGMARLLELRGLNSITVNRFHYELMSGDDSVEHSLSTRETAVEDAIFNELINRLEHGESISAMSGSQLGDALKKILSREEEDNGSGRSLLARLIAAVDPSLLEDGILSNPYVQRNMSWSAVRSILNNHLNRLGSPDPDVRHESLGKVGELILLAAQRGKENTVLQVAEKVSVLVRSESDPDVLFRAVTLIATLEEALLARGMTSIAIEVGRILAELQIMRFPREVMETARIRSLEEAWRIIDSFNAAGEIVKRLLSDDRNVSREAGRLALAMPPGNVVSNLVEIFNSSDRHTRARAFRILLNFSRRALPVLHEKLTEIRESADTLRDGKTHMLEDTAWFQVRNIVQVLREISAMESVPVLETLCRDQDPRVRRESLLALARISREEALGIAPHLLNDRSVGVSSIALSLVTRQAMQNPALTPRIIGAFRNRSLRPHVMRSLDRLAGQEEVRRFLVDGITGSSMQIPFGSIDLGLAALNILAKHGSREEMEALSEYRKKVEGALFRKSSVNRKLLSRLSSVENSLRSRLQARQT